MSVELEFDVEHGLSFDRFDDLIESLKPLVAELGAKPSTAVEVLELIVGDFPDSFSYAEDAEEIFVVDEDDAAVLCFLHVDLYVVGSLFHGEHDGCEGVLWRSDGASPVRGDTCGISKIHASDHEMSGAEGERTDDDNECPARI